MQLQVSDDGYGLEAFIVKGTTAQGWRDAAALQQRLIAVVVVDSRSGRGFNTVSLSVHSLMNLNLNLFSLLFVIF